MPPTQEDIDIDIDIVIDNIEICFSIDSGFIKNR